MIRKNLEIYFKTLGFTLPRIIKLYISVLVVTLLSAFVYFLTCSNTTLCAAATFLTAAVTVFLARKIVNWKKHRINFARIGIYVKSIRDGKVPKRAKRTGNEIMWEVYDKRLSILYLVRQTMKLAVRFIGRKRKPGFEEFFREYVTDCKSLLSFYLGNLIPFAGTICTAYYFVGKESTLFEKLKRGIRLFYEYFRKLFGKWIGWILFYTVIIAVFVVLRYGSNYEAINAFGDKYSDYFGYIITAVDKSAKSTDNAEAALVVFLTALDTACIFFPLIKPFGDISIIRRFLKCLNEDNIIESVEKASKIVFFDIDGTIWDWDGVIPDSTKQAIRRLKANGHIPVICSGRSRSHICSKELLDLPFDGIIGACGCHVEVGGKIIRERYIKKEYLPEIITLSERCGVPIVLEGPYRHWVSEKGFEGDSFVDNMRKSMGENFIPLRGYSTDMVVNKFAGDVIGTSDFDTFRNGLADHFDFIIHEIASGDDVKSPGDDSAKVLTVFECVIPGTSKADGIRCICDCFGQQPEAAFAIGDSNNDIAMLKCVGTGIAMGNATDTLKSVADYVTTDIHDDGIQNALLHFGLI